MTVAECAALQPSAKAEGVWVPKKDAKPKPPAEKKTYYKRIGGQ